MKLTFARQQALTQQTLCSLQCESFHEILVIGYQNVFDIVWVIQKKRLLRPEPEIRNVSKLLRKILEEPQRSATISEQAGEGNSSLRAGRKAGRNQLCLLHCATVC